MRLQVFDSFLTNGSGQLLNPPEATSAWRGAGIHCSSEVESCSIGGIKLGVKSIIPYPGSLVTADRRSISSVAGGMYGAWNAPPRSVPLDGNGRPGEKLVLQLYENCDELAPPGPRAPYLTRALVASLPATEATNQLVMKLPMSGRTRATIGWSGSAGDITVNLVGIRSFFGIAVGELPIPNPISFVNSGISGNGAGPAQGATIYTNQIYVDNESFDEIWVFAWSASGSSLVMIAETTGERL